MSNVVFELFAKLGLDSSEYEKGLGDAKSKASSVGGAIGNGLKTAAKIGGAAIATATAAVGAFATSSVKVGGDFDKSMSQVAATMGMTVEELNDSSSQASQNFQKLRDFAQEMGRTTAFSATEAADALNYMALAGYDAQTSMQMLPNVLNLAAAGNMDLARASDMVTDTQTAFGISLERTSQMVDEMAKAASTGNTSVEQLGDAFLVVGGLAQEMNGGMVQLSDGTTATYDNVQELEIALTAMANAGIKGSEAGTHMRNMLLKLASPTEDGYKAFTQLGVSVFDSEGKMRSLSDIMGDLGGAMSNLTQEEKLQAISDIFNTRDTAAAEALLNAVGEDWDKIAESILDADEAAQNMADTQLNNLAGDVTLFQSALEGAKIAISDKLTPSLRTFVNFGTDGLSKLTNAFQEDGLSGAVNAFGDIVTEGVNMVLTELPKMVDAGMQLLGALGQGLLNNAPLLLTTAVDIIGQLADGFIGATPVLMNGIASMLPDLMSAVVDLTVKLAEAISNPDNLTGFIEGAVNIILALAQGLLDNLPTLIEAVPVIVENLVNSLVENAPMLIDAAISLIGMLVQGIIENLPLIVASGINIVTSLVTGLIRMLPSVMAATLKLIATLLAAIVSSLPKVVEHGVKIVEATINGMVSLFGAVFETAIDMVTQFIKAIVDSAKKLFKAGQDIIDFVKDGIHDTIDQAREWGSDLIDNFIGGIKAKWEALKDTVADVAHTVWEYLHFSEPEKGDLADFHTYAPDMMNLFMQGIKDNKEKLINTVEDAFNFRDLIATPTIEYNSKGIGANGGAYNQTVNIYSHDSLSPSEIARKTKDATREMVLELRGI